MPSKKKIKPKTDLANKRKKMALGKGIEALIPEFDDTDLNQPSFFQCDIDRIRPNPYQPRRKFNPDELADLARSIEAQGILQPLVVRSDEIDYELIAGERRLRAAKLAGLSQVPVVLKDVSDTDMLEAALIENIQRENLNPMEEADAYHRLVTEFNLTQDQTARRVGKSRSAIANFLRLRQLPDPIIQSIRDDRLSMGHARALLSCRNAAQQEAIWKNILNKGLSVRQTEALTQQLKHQKESKPRPSDPNRVYFAGLAEDLSRDLGTKVTIDRKGRKGTLRIDFYNDDDLDRLIERLRQ